MSLPETLAKHVTDVYFGGNWTSVNLKDTLADVSWQEAVMQVQSLNTIAVLTYHVSYYVSAVAGVLKGEALNAKDAYSFSHPPITNERDWQDMLTQIWLDAQHLALLVEQLPEDKLWAHFTDEKYGTYYRNIQGIIEHLHYHLGQIVLIKKMIKSTTEIQ